MKIPLAGIIGEMALREAQATELGAVVRLVEMAIRTAVYPGQPDRYISVNAIYPDRAIINRDGRLYAYPYTLDDANQVQVGQPTEVIQEHLPVALREAQGSFLEAKNATGTQWRIRVIAAGLSGNNNFYSDAVLREAAPLFNGARVFEKSDEQHIAGKGKSFRQLIGSLSNAVFVEGSATDSGEIQADLAVLSSAGDAPAKMLEAFQRGMASLFGFSIDADGTAKAVKGRRIATKISKVNSVDLIIEPGAGGQLINLIEAINPQESDMSLRVRMIEAIKKAHDGNLPQGLDVNDDEALDVAYREAIKPAATAAVNTPATIDVDQKIRMVEARADMKATVAASGLPDIAQQRLRNQFAVLDNFTEAQVADAIKGEREYLANFTESGRVGGLGEGRIEGGEDRADKVSVMLDAFFDPAHKDHRNVRSFRECYVEITGDKKVTGQLQHCDAARLRESLGGDAAFREALNTASFANVLGNSITRRMQAEYAGQSNLDVYKLLTGTPVPLTDFRTQERVRYGGYGDLPIVAQDAAYAALTSPTDEKATYAAAKRGGIETLSLELIKNDDVGAIQRLPGKLARAAKRTLSKFVLDFLRTGPVIYDGVALFAAGHNNLGAAALSAASVLAQRLAMMKQTEPGSLEQLGIPPKYLWVPADLEEAAFDLFRRTTNNDTDFVESLQMQVIPVWYWTDANDFVTSADVRDIPIIELGFMDGQEEPELFIQDNPTQGSLFSNDQIRYKIRHIYGGAVAEFRGLQKNVVI